MKNEKVSEQMKKATMTRYNLNYPEKKLVRNKMSHIKCADGNELHHWSYNLEHALDFIEMTVTKHAFIHRFLIYDQEYYMYRTLKNELLDTRIKHETYINSL